MVCGKCKANRKQWDKPEQGECTTAAEIADHYGVTRARNERLAEAERAYAAACKRRTQADKA